MSLKHELRQPAESDRPSKRLHALDATGADTDSDTESEASVIDLTADDPAARARRDEIHQLQTILRLRNVSTDDLLQPLIADAPAFVKLLLNVREGKKETDGNLDEDIERSPESYSPWRADPYLCYMLQREFTFTSKRSVNDDPFTDREFETLFWWLQVLFGIHPTAFTHQRLYIPHHMQRGCHAFRDNRGSIKPPEFFAPLMGHDAQWYYDLGNQVIHPIKLYVKLQAWREAHALLHHVIGSINGPLAHVAGYLLGRQAQASLMPQVTNDCRLNYIAKVPLPP
jgi:hypothetical protein